MNQATISRRGFLTLAGAGLAGLTIPLDLSAADRAKLQRVRFGICADVHNDIMHDGKARMTTFIKEMNRKNPNFIIQMGDFCHPHPKNQDFMNIWNKFKGQRYHVIGNHDTDGGFKVSDTVKFFSMVARYYSFDEGGFHFVVLDGNVYKNGMRSFILQDQLDWLKKDLATTDAPTIIFCHQSLEDDYDGVENKEVVREILEASNKQAGGKKIIAALSGHHHIDYQRMINGIAYVQINSMSYFWSGFKNTKSYSSEILEKHKWISLTCPYKDPLYGMVTLDPTEGVMRIEGRETTFVGPSAQEVGHDNERATEEYMKRAVSILSNRKIKFDLP